MSDTASLTGLPLATDEDVLNANASFGNYARGADTLLIPRYPSSTARDTANAAGTTEGQMCVTGLTLAQQTWQQYDGSRWWDIDHGSTTFITVGSVNTKPGVTVATETIAAGAKYHVEVAVYASCTVATSDLLVTWTQDAVIPAFSRHIIGPNSGVTASPGAMTMMVSLASAQNSTGVLAGGAISTVRFEQCIISGGTSDGAVNLIVGVNTVGTAVTIDARSYVSFRRIA